MARLLVLAAGLMLGLAACGNDLADSPARPTPLPPGPDRPLEWVNVPERVELGLHETVRLTVNLSAPVVMPTVGVTYDVSRVISVSDLDNDTPGVLRFSLRGRFFGETTVTLEAMADGYETAVATFPVLVRGGGGAFDSDVIWAELGFDAFECPPSGLGGCKDAPTTLPLRDRVLNVLPIASPNFYIRTHNDEGTRLVSGDVVGQLSREIRNVVPRMTGRPFSGAVESGPEDRDAADWITVIAAVPGTHPEVPVSPGFCGKGLVGTLPGRFFIVQAPECDLLGTLRHEVGHALGFYHVSDPRLLMAFRDNLGNLTAIERDLMNRAYRLGRGAPYTGPPDPGRELPGVRPRGAGIGARRMIACP